MIADSTAVVEQEWHVSYLYVIPNACNRLLLKLTNVNSIVFILTFLQKAHAVANAIVLVTQTLIKIGNERIQSGLVSIHGRSCSGMLM